MSSHEHEPGEHTDAHEANGHPHARSARVQRALDASSAPDPERHKQERNVAVAIAVLAALVVLVLILVASGATGMFHP